MGAALRFDVADDPQSVELKALLASATPEEFTQQVTGLDTDHPLYAAVVEIVRANKS